MPRTPWLVFEIQDGLVLNFDQHWAKFCSFVVLTACNYLIELAQRNRVHYIRHEFLGWFDRIFLKPIIFVSQLDLLEWSVLNPRLGKGCIIDFVLFLRLQLHFNNFTRCFWCGRGRIFLISWRCLLSLWLKVDIRRSVTARHLLTVAQFILKCSYDVIVVQRLIRLGEVVVGRDLVVHFLIKSRFYSVLNLKYSKYKLIISYLNFFLN